MDGYIMMAFILGLPANEIVVPILIMSYMSKGAMLELDSLDEMRQLFVDNVANSGLYDVILAKSLALWNYTLDYS